MNNKEIFLSYSLEGDKWTDQEGAEIQKALASYTPESVDAHFNYWIFHKWSWGFTGRRATWTESSWRTDTVKEMVYKLEFYYDSEVKRITIGLPLEVEDDNT